MGLVTVTWTEESRNLKVSNRGANSERIFTHFYPFIFSPEGVSSWIGSIGFWSSSLSGLLQNNIRLKLLMHFIAKLNLSNDI